MLQGRRHRHGRRYRQIANVLARHGFGYLIGELGLESFVPFHRGWFGHPRRELPYTQAEHLRMALEDLGAVFIKLGQILSTRADLLPPEYLTELAKLQDAAPPVPTDVVQAAVIAELDRPLAELFASFDPTPLAAASIGQAHAATLPNGTEVVVKVRRPGVVEQVEEDLVILQNLALAASRRWEDAAQYDVVALAQEFAETLRAELDYAREGRNAERIAANFMADPDLRVPRVFWETTTSRVLTLERMRGTKISDLADLDSAGIDRGALARRAADVVLKMVFEDGFFHADPHPGNFFVEPDGGIALIDFGMVGTLDERTQDQLIEVFLAVASRDPGRLVDAVLALGVARQRVDRLRLGQDLQHLVARYVDRPLRELQVDVVVHDVLAVVRRHHLQLPSNLALIMKMGIMVEGLGAQLDPEFHLATVIEPYARQLVVRRFSPRLWLGRFSRATVDATQLGLELPGQLRRLLADLDRGALEIGMRPTGLEPMINRLERIANRIVLGLIAAAFIVGLAVLMAVYHPLGGERWMGIFFGLGSLVAGTLGLYLVWDILRSRSR